MYKQSYKPMLATTRHPPFPSNHFRPSLHQTNTHHKTSKNNTHIRSIRLPRPPFRKFDIAKRWENVRKSTSAGGAHELEDDADVAGEECHSHGSNHEGGCEDQVAIGLEGFGGEVVEGHDFAADEAFEGKGCEHVEAEATKRLLLAVFVKSQRECKHTAVQC